MDRGAVTGVSPGWATKSAGRRCTLTSEAQCQRRPLTQAKQCDDDVRGRGRHRDPERDSGF